MPTRLWRTTARAERRQDRGLSQQLANEPHAGGAEGKPHRQLLAPRAGARHQQSGHVRASHQQHHADNEEEQSQLADFIRDDAQAQAACVDHVHAEALVRLGIGLLQSASDHGQFRFARRPWTCLVSIARSVR